jgi:multidrug efflux system membrane fusion protein
VPVRVGQVEARSPGDQARFSGTVEPALQVDLAFKVGGYVEWIAGTATRTLLEEGDLVARNAVLARVRTADHLQQLASARAALAEAVAAEKLAAQEFTRTEKLVQSSTVPAAEFDTGQSRLEAARARVAAARARVAEAQLAVDDCTLRSPISGVVLQRRVELGTLASPGTVAFTIADTRTVKVQFGAPESLAIKLRPGSTLQIATGALPAPVTASVSRIAPAADPRSRMFTVESVIDNASGALRPGMVVSLVVPEGTTLEAAAVLPLTAVVRPPGKPRGFAAFVVEERGAVTRARLREVELGDVLGTGVVVHKGLRPGERVVAMGATLLHDGDPVSIIP